LNLDNLLLSLGVKFLKEGHHHCRPGWLQTDCPFCGRDTNRFHLGWNLNLHYVNCWQCGSHRVVDTLVEMTGKTHAAIRELTQGLNSTTIQTTIERRGSLVLPTGVGKLLPAHINYLKWRGLDFKSLSRLWGVRGIGLHARLPWRLFIPIHYRGRVVSWTTRSISDRGVRYLSAPADHEEINHKKLLYGEDFCRHAVIVHEGPFDTWRTGPGAVATCGTGFSKAQVLKISKYPVRVICFDNETQAQKRAEQLCDLIEPFPGETYNVTLVAKDAAEASEMEIQELRRFLE